MLNKEIIEKKIAAIFIIHQHNPKFIGIKNR
jgi:hypothetical protein